LLNDSKKLSEKQRQELEPIIKASAIAWAIASQTAAEIDASNILKASIKCMHLALDQLKKRPKFITIDADLSSANILFTTIYKSLFTNSDGTTRLGYYNSSDTFVVGNITD
jgi:ribonuclease HII